MTSQCKIYIVWKDKVPELVSVGLKFTEGHVVGYYNSTSEGVTKII